MWLSLFYEIIFKKAVLRIRIRDPGSCALLTPGSGNQNRFFPDPGSQISDPGSQTHIFESLVQIFWVKSYIILWKLAKIFFFSISQLKWYSILWILWLHKNEWQLNFCHPTLLLLFWDPGSAIRDPEWVKIRIRVKHPGSATLWKRQCAME